MAKIKNSNSLNRRKEYSIHKAKVEFSKLIRESLKGIEVVICDGSIPLVKLIPIDNKLVTRKLGLEKGEFYMSDDFNDPIEDFSYSFKMILHNEK